MTQKDYDIMAEYEYLMSCCEEEEYFFAFAFIIGFILYIILT